MTPMAHASATQALQRSAHARAWVVAGLATITGALSAVAMRDGPGMTVDSVRYAAAARTMLESGEPTTLTGDPFTLFPPGLPIVLGTIMRAGLDVEAAAAVAGVVMAVAMVVAAYWLASLALDSTVLGLLPAALVSVATPTVMLHSRLWSEPAFSVLVLMQLIAATWLVRRRRLEALPLLVVVVAGALAVWVRYIGVTLIPVAALAAGLAMRGRGAARVALAAVVVGALTAVGAITLVVRNIGLEAEPFGARSDDGSTVIAYLVDTAATLGAYVLPQPLAGAAVAAGLAVAALLAYGTYRAVSARDAAMAVVLAFVACYWLALLVIGLLTSIEFMRYRLAAPAFVPLLVIAVYGGRDLWARARGRQRTLVAAGVALTLLLMLPVALAQSAAYAWVAAGHGYSSPAALGSPLAAAAARLPQGARLASNDPSHLYWATGRGSVSYLQALRDPASVDYLVVFRSEIPGTSRLTGADPVLDGLPVSVVAELEDGTIYAVDGAPPADRLQS